MHLFNGVLPELAFRSFHFAAGIGVELLVFFRRELGSMAHLSRCFVWSRKIREVRNPAVPNGGLHELPKCNGLMVERAARQNLARLFMRLETRDTVFLHETRGNGAKCFVAEERQQVIVQPCLVALNVTRAALAVGDGIVFQHELLGRVREGFFLLELAHLILSP